MPVTPISATIGILDPHNLGVFSPRFWLGSTVVATGSVLSSDGKQIPTAGVSFAFYWRPDPTVQAQVDGVFNAETKVWEGQADLNRAGVWDVNLMVSKPERQSDWIELEIMPPIGGVIP